MAEMKKNERLGGIHGEYQHTHKRQESRRVRGGGAVVRSWQRIIARICDGLRRTAPLKTDKEPASMLVSKVLCIEVL